LKHWFIVIFLFSLFTKCKKDSIIQGKSVKYDTLSVVSTVTYKNCSNTTSMMVQLNKKQMITWIIGAGNGDKNRAQSDSANYSINLMDTSHNTVKPLNLLHPLDSIEIVLFFDTNKPQLPGDYGYSIHTIVKSNSKVLIDNYYSRNRPLIDYSTSNSYYLIMP